MPRKSPYSTGQRGAGNRIVAAVQTRGDSRNPTDRAPRANARPAVETHLTAECSTSGRATAVAAAIMPNGNQTNDQKHLAAARQRLRADLLPACRKRTALVAATACRGLPARGRGSIRPQSLAADWRYRLAMNPTARANEQPRKESTWPSIS